MAEISKIKLADGSIVELKDAKARELINSRAVGQPTDDGGEIFNDYTNNSAGEFAHAEGQHTIAFGVASHAEGKSEMSISDEEVGIGTIKGWYADAVEGQENTYSIGAYSQGPSIGTQFWAEEGGIATVISINERVVDMGTGETWTEYDSYVTDKPVFIYQLYGSEPYAIIHTVGAKGDHSHVEGYNTLADGIGAHAEGLETQAIGNYSHTEGGTTIAQGKFSHAEGRKNSGFGFASHAEGGEGYYAMGYESDEPTNYGDGNEAFGSFSHVEGNNTQAGSLIDENGWAAHAEGSGSVALGYASHAENWSRAEGDYSHAEGAYTKAESYAAHAEGDSTTASGYGSHAEGSSTVAHSDCTHAEGENSQAIGYAAHAEGMATHADEEAAHAEGIETVASNRGSHAEGCETTASGEYSHAEGNGTTASGDCAHAEGCETTAGLYSHAEGSGSKATGQSSHAEGEATIAEGGACHAEGDRTLAQGHASHVEGFDNKALGEGSHSEGSGTEAISYASHAEGEATIAEGYASHAEGGHTMALGEDSHAEGNNTIATGYASHAEGTSCFETAVKISGAANDVNFQVIDGIFSYQVGLFLKYGRTICRIVSATTKPDSSLQLADSIVLDKPLSETEEIIESSAVYLVGGAVGECSHVSGIGSYASGKSSHAQGYHTIASGDYSTAFGYGAIASGPMSYAEGGVERCTPTMAIGHYSHAEGVGSRAIGPTSHAQGFLTSAEGSQSHSEGYQTESLNSRTHAEGHRTFATGIAAHSQGRFTFARGDYSHAEGICEIGTPWFLNYTQGLIDVTEVSRLNNEFVYAWGGTKGEMPTAGSLMWATNDDNTVSLARVTSVDQANNTFIVNKQLHLVNKYARKYLYGALCYASHVEGAGTVAGSPYQHVEGKYNINDDQNQYVHIVGAGTGVTNSAEAAAASLSNIHTLEWTGNATYAGAITSSTGADYAEYFEWEDGNPNNEDRVGLLVTIQGEKIRLANMGEEILGVVSGTAAVIGDTAEWEWQEKYLRDKFGRVIWEPVEQFVEEYNEETGETEKFSIGFIPQRKLNPNYDPEQEYVSRAKRKEWDTIGMLGKLHVIDDGSCKVGEYATVGLNGKAMISLSKTNMYVMKRIDETTILVLLK